MLKKTLAAVTLAAVLFSAAVLLTGCTAPLPETALTGVTSLGGAILELDKDYFAMPWLANAGDPTSMRLYLHRADAVRRRGYPSGGGAAPWDDIAIWCERYTTVDYDRAIDDLMVVLSGKSDVPYALDMQSAVLINTVLDALEAPDPAFTLTVRDWSETGVPWITYCTKAHPSWFHCVTCDDGYLYHLLWYAGEKGQTLQEADFLALLDSFRFSDEAATMATVLTDYVKYKNILGA